MLRAELKEKEKVLHLEEYSRRENLTFRNVPECPSENCKELIFDIGRPRHAGCLSKEESIKRIYSLPKNIHNLGLPK